MTHLDWSWNAGWLSRGAEVMLGLLQVIKLLVEVCVLLHQAPLSKNSAPDQAAELELEEFSIKSYIIDGKIHLEVNN